MDALSWVWWVLIAVAVVAALDRLASWAESRGWIYWRRRKPTGGGGTALGDLLLLFQPTRQHLVEEQDRQRWTIVQKEEGEPAEPAVDPGDPGLPLEIPPEGSPAESALPPATPPERD